MMRQLDIKGNRANREHSASYICQRAGWEIGRILFRFVPVPFFCIRSTILRCFGAKIGRDVHIHPKAIISYPWNLEISDESSLGERAFIDNHGKVTIGQRATISQLVHICAGTHDYTDPTMPLQMPPVTIGNDAWVCAGSFVGPGVTIGDGAVIGARSVVIKDIKPWSVAVGHPAVEIKARELRPPSA